MRPSADYLLNTLATTMIDSYLPRIKSDHERAGFARIAVVMKLIAEELDRAAHRRIEENRAFRKIFLESLPVIRNNELRRRVKAASETTEDDYHVSALDRLNCELQEVLIDLHAHLETLEGENARSVEEAIWQELENRRQRRRFSIWNEAYAILAAASQNQNQ